MAYLRNNLISRKTYSSFSGWTDTVGDIAKGALSFFGAQQRATGAQEALSAQLAAQQQAAAPSTGPSTTTVLLIAGGVGVAALLLLKKKKPATAA